MSPTITIRDLTMSFDSKEVLRGINLDVMPGQILGYLGPNGAGKTTTVRILIGMQEGFGGEVTVAGVDVRRDSLEVKRRIGYVPESAALYETLTPMEYLRFIGRLYRLDEAEIARRSTRMLTLFGLEAELHNRMSTFSKGMKQKVLLSAGVIHDPEVIFLDEPLSGLDANAAVTVKEILGHLAAAGKTIFYCSHVMDVVERVCDRIVILNKGQIVADGSFEELQQRDKEASLERIFTQLTSEGEHIDVARQFVSVLNGGREASHAQ
jgi:ABC-2 type transport system ATP-binding protein